MKIHICIFHFFVQAGFVFVQAASDSSGNWSPI